MAAEPVRITGLREFQASLRRMDGQTQKQLRLVLNDAAQVVVEGAQALVPVRTGAARASIRAQSTQREARVSAGGGKVPYYPWLDFGGAVGRAGGIQRPFYKEGRYLYPTYRTHKSEFATKLAKSLSDLVTSSGLAVE